MKTEMAEVSAQVEKAKGDLARMEAEIGAMPEGSEKETAMKVAAKISEGIAASEKWLGKATQTVGVLEAALVNAQDGFDVAQAALDAAKTVAPPPWGYLASVLGGLVLGLIRAGYNRWTARKIVRSVDGIVAPDKTAAAAISLIQGASGKRIVDEAQGKKLALPI